MSSPDNPFNITPDEERELRQAGMRLSPSPFYHASQPFDGPQTVVELYKTFCGFRLADWQVESIQASLFTEGALLHRILAWKTEADGSHPPNIRVGLSGKGDFDDSQDLDSGNHRGDFGCPSTIEIWPSAHYSPIHQHGDTTGIILGLAGELDIMEYAVPEWSWDGTKVGLITVTAGDVCWLDKSAFAVHKVACRMPPGQFSAILHVFPDQGDHPHPMPRPHTGDIFEYIDESLPHDRDQFITYSDLSYAALMQEVKRISNR
jgi:hypothetical protein